MSVILSEHALKGNGDKLVKDFLTTLESATSWLDFCECLCMGVWKSRNPESGPGNGTGTGT